MLHSSLSVFEPALVNHATSGLDSVRSGEIAVICHELRNSLAVVRNAARLLRPDGGGLSTARALIERQVVQMTRHIDDLLPQSHGDHSEGLQLSVVDLRAVARNAIDAIGPEIARRGHRLNVMLPESPVEAHADGGRLEQALSNLLINAAKYTPNEGEITFVMEHDHELARISVRDTGVGIEPAMLTRIFGMFVQASSPLPWAEKGSGIGLAVVENVVHLHGGTVKATSPGRGLGSEFTLMLPALEA